MRKTWAGFLMTAATVTGGAHRAGAQATAHFGWAQHQVGAGFSWPMGVAVDGNGDVFVVDNHANTVNEILAVNGVIPANPEILPLGSGFNGPTAVAVDASGDVFVADRLNSQVKEIVAVNHTIPAKPTIRILAPNYQFSDPQGIAVDAYGDVFVTDFNGAFLLELVAVSGSVPQNPSVLKFGGNFANPISVAVDSHGDAFVVDAGVSKVYELSAVRGSIPINATPQPAGSGSSDPASVAVDASGDVFVSDIGATQIEEIVAVQGTLPENPAMVALGEGINDSLGIAVDGMGNVFASSPNGGVVSEVSTEGFNFGRAAVGTGSEAAIPLLFIFDQAGTLGVAPKVSTEGLSGLDFTDTGNGTCTTNGTTHEYAIGDTCTVDVTFKPTATGLRRGAATLTDVYGGTIAEAYIQGYGTAPQIGYLPGTQIIVDTNLSSVGGIAVDAAGDVFVSDTVKHLVKFDALSNGSYSTQGTFGGGWSPVSLAVDGAGDFLVADTAGNAIQKLTVFTLGYELITAVSGLKGPIAVDGSGRIYVADTVHNRVLVERQQGLTYTVSAVISPVIAATALAVDAAHNLYAVEAGGVVLHFFDNGLYRSHSLVAQVLAKASGIAVDLNGDVFIADTPSNQILEETPTGTGTYTQSVWLTGIRAPGALALDRFGNLYIAETGNNRVLKEDYSEMPVFAFAPTTQGKVAAAGDQVEIIESMGTERLQFASVSFPSDFPEEGGTEDCVGGNDITPGYGCTISVKFLPTATMGSGATATLNEKVSVLTNSLNGTDVEGGVKASGVELKPVSVTLATNTTTTTASVGITATATVAGASGTPTGTVQFYIDGVTAEPAVTLVSGKASQTLIFGVGKHTVTARYSGSSAYPSQTSAAVTIEANAAKTTASATLSAPVSVVTGKPLTITTTIAESLAGVLPTGTVKVYVIPPGSTTATLKATLTVNASRQAVWSSTSGAAGTYKVYAVYEGDENYTSATTNTSTFVVTAQ